MAIWENVIQDLGSGPIRVLDAAIPINDYVRIDLSVHNREIAHVNIGDPILCQAYINKTLKKGRGQVAYGGYLEERNLYRSHSAFSKNGAQHRNIHLGMDFWSNAGTKVLAPIKGKVHSFGNNAAQGDYGPTIILEHHVAQLRFYTLYGHLSLQSIQGLWRGKDFKAGDVLGTLGTTAINVNYAPHLHFQVIGDMEGHCGDYPGVASIDRLDFYRENCPDPNLLLKL